MHSPGFHFVRWERDIENRWHALDDRTMRQRTKFTLCGLTAPSPYDQSMQLISRSHLVNRGNDVQSSLGEKEGDSEPVPICAECLEWIRIARESGRAAMYREFETEEFM